MSEPGAKSEGSLLKEASVWIVGGFMLLTLGGLWTETRGFRAKSLAFLAQGLSEAGRGEEAMIMAERALDIDVWQPQAMYLRCVKLKESGQWEKLENSIAPLLLCAPNPASALRLAAESAFRAKKTDAGRERMKAALWMNPFPPTGPTNFWRMMMVASTQAEEKNWALGAAMRTVEFTSDDPVLNETERQGALNDAAAVLQQAGLNRTAAHLQNAGRAAGKR